MAKVTITSVEITRIENVFVCAEHSPELIEIHAAETLDCEVCSKPMENAGWFESHDCE